MYKYFFVLIIFLATIGAGCTPIKNAQEKNNQVRVIDWCDHAVVGAEEVSDDQLWISSEYFNGMNHGPTIRRVCRGNEELFSLKMVWDDSASVHTGSLISKKSEASLPISSELKDPEFELTQNQDKDKVLFTIDKKIFVYDENDDKFIEN